MNFAEKLAKLTVGRNKQDVGKAAGLPRSAVSDYIAKQHIPRADKGIALAKILAVPAEWLFDDSQNWPAPKADSLTDLSTGQLTGEIGRRMLGTAKIMFAKIGRASSSDWVKILKELYEFEVEKSLPKRLREVVELPGQLNLLMGELEVFNPHAQVGEGMPPELLVLPDFEITLLDLYRRKRNLEESAGYYPASQLAALWLIPKEYRPPWFNENVKHARDLAAAELAKLNNLDRRKKSKKS